MDPASSSLIPYIPATDRDIGIKQKAISMGGFLLVFWIGFDDKIVSILLRFYEIRNIKLYIVSEIRFVILALLLVLYIKRILLEITIQIVVYAKCIINYWSDKSFKRVTRNELARA